MEFIREGGEHIISMLTDYVLLNGGTLASVDGIPTNEMELYVNGVVMPWEKALGRKFFPGDTIKILRIKENDVEENPDVSDIKLNSLIKI